jgi:hypothetical protein
MNLPLRRAALRHPDFVRLARSRAQKRLCYAAKVTLQSLCVRRSQASLAEACFSDIETDIAAAFFQTAAISEIFIIPAEPRRP